MLITLKGLDGSAVIVNTDHIIYIGAAADERKMPLLNACGIVFIGGTGLVVRGTAAEVAAILEGPAYGRTPGVSAN